MKVTIKHAINAADAQRAACAAWDFAEQCEGNRGIVVKEVDDVDNNSNSKWLFTRHRRGGVTAKRIGDVSGVVS